MYTLVIVLIIIVCVLLALVVLIQNPKGGGIASNFASSNQIMGVKRTSESVEKATWILAIALIVLTLFTNFLRPVAGEPGEGKKSKLEDKVSTAPAPAGPANSGQQNPSIPPGDQQAPPNK